MLYAAHPKWSIYCHIKCTLPNYIAVASCQLDYFSHTEAICSKSHKTFFMTSEEKKFLLSPKYVACIVLWHREWSFVLIYAIHLCPETFGQLCHTPTAHVPPCVVIDCLPFPLPVTEYFNFPYSPACTCRIAQSCCN